LAKFPDARAVGERGTILVVRGERALRLRNARLGKDGKDPVEAMITASAAKRSTKA
jgi:hypothetical protein